MLIQVFFFRHIFKPWETVNLYSQFSLLCPNHFTYFRPSININTLLSSLDTFSLISYREFIFFPVRILEKRTETLSTRWRKLKKLMFCIDLQPKHNCGFSVVKIVYSFILTCMFAGLAFMTTGDLSSNLSSVSVKSLLCMYTKQAYEWVYSRNFA